jgi:CheY-like chemotaxis protein
MPRSRRILVVDDNMDQVHTMAVLLRELGHEVRFALNGASALREARGFMPEVMFVDLGLPDMDGPSLCRQLHAEPALHDARIFAITGSSRQEDWDEVMAAGCERLLLKPVDPKFLQSLLGG